MRVLRPPTCTTCRFFDGDRWRILELCRWADAAQPGKQVYDPVHGRAYIEPARPNYAREMRRPLNHCGPEGRLWQPTRAYRLKSWFRNLFRRS